jgi:curved DNA-binding protein CbpA
MSGIKRQSPFQILGVTPAATKSEIRKAWKTLVKANHPDRNPNDRDGATERLVAVNAAYDKLRNHEPIILKSHTKAANDHPKAKQARQTAETEAKQRAAAQAAKARAEAQRQAKQAQERAQDQARRAAAVKSASRRVFSLAEMQAMQTAKREFASAQMAFHTRQKHVFSTAA